MATRVISTSIKLDGETEFKKQLSAVNASLRTLNSDMKLVTEEFKGQANSLEALTAKDKILTDQLAQQREKARALEQALAEASQAYGENDKRVDGYRQSLNGAKTEIIKLERELAQNNRYLDEAKSSADGAAKSIDQFGTPVKEAKERLEELGEATERAGEKALNFGDLVKANIVSDLVVSAVKNLTEAMVDFAKSSLQTGMEFDAAMSQVAATMGVPVESVENLREAALEMGRTTAFTATEAAEALNYMALAGYDADTAIEMLPTVLNLAAAGAMDLGKASDMITDTQSALGLSLDETAVLVDQMAKAASKSNTSVEQLGDAILTVGGTASYMAGGTEEIATVLGILADNGIKASEGGTYLRNILLALTTPTDDAAEALAGLGVRVFDAEGQVRSFSEIFPELGDALSQLSDQDQLAALDAIFNSRDIAAANALLGTSIERWEELEAAIVDSSGAAETMAATQLDNLEGDVTLFKSALEGAQIAISDQMEPALRSMVQAGTGALSELTEAIPTGEFGEVAGRITAELLESFADAAPEMVDAGVEMLQGLLEGLVKGDSPERIAEAMGKIVVTLVEGGAAALPDVLRFAVRLVTALVQGLAFSLPDLLTAAANAMVDLSLELLKSIPDFIVAGAQLLAGVEQGIINFLGTLITRIAGVASALLDKFKEVLGIHSPSKEFESVGEYMMQGLVLGMENSKGEVMKTVEDIATEVTTRFKAITDALDTKSSVAELRQQLWDLTEGQTASVQERYERLLSRFEEQKILQSGVVDAARAAYEAMSAQYGENSSEALEQLETLLKEQIAYQKMENEFSESLEDLFDDLADEREQQASVAEKQHSLWESLEGKSASTSEKYEKQLDLLSEKEALQAEVVDAAVAAYETLAEQYGDNSQQARQWLDTVLEEVEAYQELAAAIEEVLNKQPKLAELGYSASSYDMSASVLSRLAAGAPSTRTVTSADVYNAAAAVGNAVTQSGSGGSGTTMVKTTINIDSRSVAEAITPALRDADKSNPEVVSDTL